MACKCNDCVLDADPDGCFVHARLPAQFIFDVFLELSVATHNLFSFSGSRCSCRAVLGCQTKPRMARARGILRQIAHTLRHLGVFHTSGQSEYRKTAAMGLEPPIFP
jgi:hypothetical protein